MGQGPCGNASAVPRDESATSHPYCALVEKLGHVEPLSSDSIVSRLAVACRFRAVDQKYVSDRDILSLADRALERP